MALGVTAGRKAGRGIAGDRRAEMWTGIAFVAIPLFLYVFLYFGAMVYAAYISLWRWGLRGPREYLGIENYQDILGDPIFWKAVANTAYYVAIWIPLTMALGLFLAVIVNEGIRGRTFFRAAFYFPTLASSAAITVVWIFLLQPEGLFNAARETLGLNPLFAALGFDGDHNWLGSSRTAMNAIIFLNAWTTSGTIMLFYLTFLQTISREIYEAAAIDGAGAWQTFRRITFPLLRPAHFFVATLLADRRLQALRPGDHRRRPGRGAEQCTYDDRAVHLSLGDHGFRVRLRRGSRRRPVRDHLHADARPAAPVRRGPIVVSRSG